MGVIDLTSDTAETEVPPPAAQQRKRAGDECSQDRARKRYSERSDPILLGAEATATPTQQRTSTEWAPSPQPAVALPESPQIHTTPAVAVAGPERHPESRSVPLAQPTAHAPGKKLLALVQSAAGPAARVSAQVSELLKKLGAALSRAPLSPAAEVVAPQPAAAPAQKAELAVLPGPVQATEQQPQPPLQANPLHKVRRVWWKCIAPTHWCQQAMRSKQTKPRNMP